MSDMPTTPVTYDAGYPPQDDQLLASDTLPFDDPDLEYETRVEEAIADAFARDVAEVALQDLRIEGWTLAVRDAAARFDALCSAAAGRLMEVETDDVPWD